MVDPFLLYSSLYWSSEKQSYHLKLTTFHRLNLSPYSDEESKSLYKSLESYKCYESKYVREMYVKSFDGVKLIMVIVQQFSELLDASS
jgi:hypothetical protein